MPYARRRRSTPMRLLHRFSIRPVSLWEGQSLAVLVTLAATALRLLLEPILEGSFAFITYFPAILIAALWGGAVAGLSTLILSLTIMAYLWLAPQDGFPLTARSWVILLVVLIFGSLLLAVGATIRSLVAELARSEARATLLAHEMKHRVGNLIGMVAAISRQTARSTTTQPEYQVMFEARLQALAHAQRIFSADPDVPGDLRELVDLTIDPFERNLFSLGGPTVNVPHDFSGSLALLIHELCTNALKHGALSVEGGRVAIHWSLDEGQVNFTWQESGGPAVVAPSRAGFGSQLLKFAFPPEVGQASIDFDPTGVRCSLRFPSAVDAEERKWSMLWTSNEDEGGDAL